MHSPAIRFVVRCSSRKVVRMRIVARMSAGDVGGGFDLEEPGAKSVGNSKSVLTLVLFFLSSKWNQYHYRSPPFFFSIFFP